MLPGHYELETFASKGSLLLGDMPLISRYYNTLAATSRLR